MRNVLTPSRLMIIAHDSQGNEAVFKLNNPEDNITMFVDYDIHGPSILLANGLPYPRNVRVTIEAMPFELSAKVYPPED